MFSAVVVPKRDLPLRKVVKVVYLFTFNNIHFLKDSYISLYTGITMEDDIQYSFKTVYKMEL